jgi:membrane fusion protein, multidrug efflux system
MKWGKWLFIVIVLICLAGGAFYYYATFEKKPRPLVRDAGPSVPVAMVRMAPIKRDAMSEVITAYGMVVPEPGAVRSLSVPFESRVRHVLITEGQRVSAGSDLIEIEPSADTRLKMQEAKNDYRAVGQNLGKIRERVKLKVGTIEELLTAQQAYQKAKIRLENLEKRGIGEKKIIRSVGSGIVYRLHVKEGSVVPAGTGFLDMVPQDRVGVQLSAEQEDIKRLRPGQAVLISKVNTRVPVSVNGRIEMISRTVNQATRLVNIFVSVKSPDGFLLGEYMCGRIIVVSKKALVVPRSAVLPEDGHFVLYTVSQGLARKHIVKTGLEDHQHIEIIAKGLDPGNQVVVLGNYELQDGMPVRMEASR